MVWQVFEFVVGFYKQVINNILPVVDNSLDDLSLEKYCNSDRTFRLMVILSAEKTKVDCCWFKTTRLNIFIVINFSNTSNLNSCFEYFQRAIYNG